MPIPCFTVEFFIGGEIEKDILKEVSCRQSARPGGPDFVPAGAPRLPRAPHEP